MIPLAALLFAAAADPKPVPVTFDGAVKGILAKRCGKCHAGDRPRGDLDLTTYANVMQGGIGGKAVVAGRTDASPLYTLTAHIDEPKMPPNGPKIPQSEIDTLAKWIDGGLVEKASGSSTAPSAKPAVSPGGLTTPAELARRTPVTALAASPVAPLTAVAGNRQVLVYDAGRPVGGLPFPEGEVHALRFSRDGKTLLAAGGVGGQSGAVVGFAVEGWTRRFTVTDPTDAALAADLSPDGTRVVFGGPGRIVKVAAVADGKILHSFRKPTDWVQAVGFSPDGLLVAAGDRFGGLYLWDAAEGQEFAALRGHTKGVTALGWRADGDVLVSASDDGTVRLWDLHSAAEVAKLDAHAGGVLALDVHRSGRIATGGRDRAVRLWTIDGKPARDLGTADDEVMRVAVAADGQTVTAGDWAGFVRTWPAAGGDAVPLPLPVAARSPTVAVVQPVMPAVRPPAPTLDTARTAVQAAEADLAPSRKAVAAKAAAAALAHLKLALAADPDNAALKRAVAEAEAAVRSLTPGAAR